MCVLFCTFNMEKTNQQLIKYGYYTSTISRVVAIRCPGLPGAQEAAA